MNRKRKTFFAMLQLAAFLFVTLGCMFPARPAQAAALSHTKATSADVRNSGNAPGGALKGLQGTDFADSYNDTVSNLNLNAMFLNVDISSFLNTSGTGTPYTYHGKTYYFNDGEGSMLKVIESRVKQYRQQGVTWTFCLVMSWSDDPEIQKLMYQPTPGKIFYALNVTDAEASETISAILHYLAEKFSYSDTFVQNWRIGNEVNVKHDYNYTGTNDANTLETLAIRGYDLLDQALRDNNPNALAYVSLTHDWNNDNDGTGVPTKDFLNAFAAAESGKNWNLDFHAYPPQMKEQVWTKASASYLRNDEDTAFICAPNLNTLTDYIKKNFGSNHRIILSEQGFDSSYGEEEQAAMMAYTYYAAANNDMVDAVIFTAYQDTNSFYHDFYNMGIVRADGSHKASYSVFQYMNTDTEQATANSSAYLSKLSSWTGRNIQSWTDDILYQVPATTATLSEASVYMPDSMQEPSKNKYMIGITTSPANANNGGIDLEYMWTAFCYDTNQTETIKGWSLNQEWLAWYPTYNGSYEIYGYVRVAGNPSSSMTIHVSVGVTTAAARPQSQGREVPYYNLNTNGGSWDGTYYTTPSGSIAKDVFFCDGTYTYYLQADGTAMKNRLTYHPDGIHIIYFDEYGHEVFSDFTHVKKSISGEDVDDYCFFDVFGYMYVDVLTYDRTGNYLYYANPYGVLEVGKWFQFSDTVKWADGTPCVGIAGGYGYANANGTLMTNTYTYDWLGNLCYLQGNGVKQ